MRLLDEEEIQRRKMKNQKMRRLIVLSIIILTILCFVIIALIIYRTYNPNKITTYINGVKVENFDSILDMQTDENGKTQIYVPIKTFASKLGYLAFNGEYSTASEENDKCYVTIKNILGTEEDYENAMYTLQSKTIYKLNLQNKTDDYDYCYADSKVFEENGELYTSMDGIAQGLNLSFSYDENKKIITIYTLDYLINFYKEQLATKILGNYGVAEVDESYQNWKSVFDNMLIISTEKGKAGVVNISDYSFVLEPKYDNIEYVQYASDFVIKTNEKFGILSKEGKTKINAVYDEITLMDRDNGIYRIKKDNLYGVIDENENIIIHPENTAIGINVDNFSYNNIKNGYIILGELIPVKQKDKWALYNLKGESISQGFIYDNIGYVASNSNNIYSLLEIPEYDVIIVGANKKYTFMDKSGNNQILPFIFDEIYIKVSSGEYSYWMTYNDKTYNVKEYLEKAGLTSKTEKD